MAPTDPALQLFILELEPLEYVLLLVLGNDTMTGNEVVEKVKSLAAGEEVEDIDVIAALSKLEHRDFLTVDKPVASPLAWSFRAVDAGKAALGRDATRLQRFGEFGRMLLDRG